MKGDAPFILLRARVRDERSRFAAWFRAEHLREIRKIPGVTAAFWGETADQTQLGIYCFEDPQSMQAAFGSAEAGAARTGWGQWGELLEEFSVEMQFSVTPPTVSVSLN